MASEAETESNGQELEPGIRGWLRAFVIWIGVISPLWTLGLSLVITLRLQQANTSDAALMHRMGWDVLLWGVTLGRASLRIATALLMHFRRVASSVWFALVVLWLSGPLLILGAWAVLGGEMNVVGLVRSALIALAWTLFLIISRRVKITYNFRTGV